MMPMKVAEFLMSSDYISEDSWTQIHGNASFTHNTACEAILYVRDIGKKDFGFITNDEDRQRVYDLAVVAKTEGFDYLCIYT